MCKFASSFERVGAIHCLATLDLGAGVKQPFDCLIIQHRQAGQSMVRSMDSSSEDNMVDGLFLFATLTGRSGGNTPCKFAKRPPQQPLFGSPSASMPRNPKL